MKLVSAVPWPRRHGRRGRSRQRACVGLALLVASAAAATAGVDLWKVRPKTAADCDALVRDAPGDLEAYRCYHVVGIVHGRWDDALAGLRALVARRPDEPRARLYLGLALRDQNMPREAREQVEVAAAGLHRLGVHDGEVHARLMLALMRERAGDHEGADREMRSAERAVAQAKDVALAALVEREYGLISTLRDRWADAYRRYERARALLDAPDPAIANSPLVRSGWAPGLVLEGSAHVALELGRQREALGLFEQYAAQRERQHDLFHLASARYNIALIKTQLVRRGEIEGKAALDAIERTIEAARRSGRREIEVYALLLRSRFLPLPEQLPVIDAALASSRLFEDRVLEGWCLLYRSAVRFGLGDVAGARREVAQALDVLPEALGRVSALTRQGEYAWSAGDRDAAVSSWTRAIGLIERSRDEQRDDFIGAQAFATRSLIYYDVSGSFLEAYETGRDPADLQRAFAAMERQRARGLRGALPAPTAGSATSGTSASSAAPGPSVEDEVTLDDVRAALGEDEAVIAFQLPDRQPVYSRAERDDNWAVVISRARAGAVRVAPRKQADDEVPLYLGLVARRDPGADQAAGRLYQGFLEAPLRLLDPSVRRLVFVADGPLHRVPFAALRARSDAPPLAATYVLNTVASVTALVRARAARVADGPPRRTSVLAFADPPLGPALETANTMRAATLDDRLALAPLPRARREVSTIVAQFGDHGAGRAGKDASEWRLKSAPLGDVGLLHFATHAVIDEVHPERSALLLAAGHGEDGLLQPAEIERLPLQGAAVVLSACRSADGRVLEGEGPMSLARAFFRAGASVVVGGLWPLRDDEQERLATAFTREVGRGASVGEALSAAQREAREDGAPVAAWAGMVALGDGDVVPFPGGANAPAPGGVTGGMALGAGLAALAALAALGLRVRRSKP